MLRLAPVVLAAALALAERTDVGNLGAADNAWLILVDDLHLSFTQTGRLRDLLRKVAAELIQDGDRYELRASGPSAASLTTGALTDDRSLASSAIKFMTGNGLNDSDLLASGALTFSAEVLYRANTALDAAEEAVFALTREAAPRQAIVYVSSGYDVEAFPAIAARVSAVARRARENNITIFPIDARGFAALPIPDPRLDAHTIATRRSLSMIAHDTGGFVIERPSTPDVELKRISAQMRK